MLTRQRAGREQRQSADSSSMELKTISADSPLMQKSIMPGKTILTSDQLQCLDISLRSREHLFITGEAGTGKSFLAKYYRGMAQDKIPVLAPTGIAALNIGGQTIHSFCQFKPAIIDNKAVKENPYNKGLIKKIDTIIVDEISMVRADLFDGLDQFMRKHGRDNRLPFGGARLIMVGDPFQLPPVVSRNTL